MLKGIALVLAVLAILFVLQNRAAISGWIAGTADLPADTRTASWHRLRRRLAETWHVFAIVYILGILAIAYHLGNGAHTALMSWGAVTTRRALKQWELLAWVLFIALLALGWGAVYALYRAGAAT
jgi:succinate dehydrogenase/fumarate reductase cytochrome b subunit